MNFETRSDFTGIELSANHKVIRGSGGDTEVGFIGGLNFAGGRGHITTSASGIRRSELEIYRRDWAILPYEENPKGGWSSTGRPATFIPGSSTDVNTNGIIDPNCAALGGAPTGSNKRCRFQYTPFDNLVEKTRIFTALMPSVTTKPVAGGPGMPGTTWAGYSADLSVRTARCAPNR